MPILSLIESLAERHEVEAFQPAELLASVIAPFRALAQAKGVALDWAIEADVPDLVWGHAGTLRAVLADLVKRALDSTAMGAVVAIAKIAGSDAAPMICFEVADTGLGAAPELSARRAMDRIGGTFHVLREPYRGSRCTLTVGYAHRPSGPMLATRRAR